VNKIENKLIRDDMADIQAQEAGDHRYYAQEKDLEKIVD